MQFKRLKSMEAALIFALDCLVRKDETITVEGHKVLSAATDSTMAAAAVVSAMLAARREHEVKVYTKDATIVASIGGINRDPLYFLSVKRD